MKKFKRTLKHRFAGRLLFLLELEAGFKIVASILNSRPIYARWGARGGSDTDYLSALTPNMLLTGRANVELPIRNYDTSDKPLHRLQYVEEVVSQWWEQFMTQNFSSLVPRQKWLLERRNLCVGDVVLIKYEGKCSPGTYRLGVVCEVELSPDGLVRTATVEYSLLAELPEAERHLYKGITKKRIRVPVQRLVLILPVDERDPDLLPGGQAGHDPAPLDEVDGQDTEGQVGSLSKAWDYPCVYDQFSKKYVWDIRAAEVTWDSCRRELVYRRHSGDGVQGVQGGHGHRQEQGELVLGDVQAEEGVHCGLTSKAGIHGHGQHAEAGGVHDGPHSVEEDEEGVGVSSGIRKELKMKMQSCNSLEGKKVYEDFEKRIYHQHSLRFDWKEMYDED